MVKIGDKIYVGNLGDCEVVSVRNLKGVQVTRVREEDGTLSWQLNVDENSDIGLYKINVIPIEQRKLLKFYDENSDFEEFILIKNKDIGKAVKILEKCRKLPEYNWDDYVAMLKESGLKIECPVVEKMYF